VAANISMTGIRLVRRSTAGLMDHALGPEQRQIAEALAHFDDGGMRFHAVRTRQGGHGRSRRCRSSCREPGRCSADTTRQGG
jgi:divalent metal cation (Fe/Co/Zn/Cd) transporter